MTPKRLLDLFCGAGGASEGYRRAGFEVVGVDIEPQPNYPFTFHQLDALDATEWAWFTTWADAIHASPPCQFGTAYKRRPSHVKDSPNLIPQTREWLMRSRLPYIIENNYSNRNHLWRERTVMYCGSSFGLDVQRHRMFEASFGILPPPCDHHWQTPRFPPATNRTNLRRTVEVGVWRIPLDVQRRAMGIDWMTLEELSEAIPPAYTEHIGGQLMAKLMLKHPPVGWDLSA